MGPNQFSIRQIRAIPTLIAIGLAALRLGPPVAALLWDASCFVWEFVVLPLLHILKNG
jgi:hypothetical protein